MRTRSKLLSTGVLAALALATAVANSPAARLSVDEPKFRMVFQPISFYLEAIPARCNLTLEGSFSPGTFAKTSGVKARSALTASFGSCSSPATLLMEALPWEFIYTSFGGALPTIGEVNFDLRAVAFNVEVGSGSCLIRAVEEHARASFKLGAGGAVRELVLPRTSILPLTEACRLIYHTGSVSGTGTITKPNSTESIHITLI